MPAPIRYLSVCSGMEAASVAWHPLGFQAVGFSEIEPFPCAILKHRFPNTTNYGSLTEHTSWQIEQGAVDLFVGGTPCQSFSVAGLRKGMSDPRGNLALTFLALADRLRPRWIVWENVPGVLSSNGGRDFGSFLSALGQLGYGFAYRVLDAQYFGVPQRRRRVFVVACLGNSTAPAEVLSIAEGLRGYIEKGNKKRKGSATDAGKSVEANGCQWWDGRDTAQTLTVKGAGGDQRMPDKGNFGALLEPKPIVIDRAAFNQGVNAQYEPHIAESEVMDSLVARGPHAVGQPIPFRKSKRAQSTTDDESWVKAEASNTLNNFVLGDTRTTHAVVEPISIQGTIIGRSETAGPTVMQAMAVRRLTPVECERLQGFPDNWSRISWKGKPEEDCPDGPRYKACGNSMAVPVMRWIGERIKEVDAKLSK